MTDETHVGKIEQELAALKRLWKRSRTTFWVMLSAAILYASYVNIWGIPALRKKIGELEAKKKELNDDNQRLHNKSAEGDAKIADLKQDLLPFQTYSLQKYGGTEREALIKLAEDLERIQRQIRSFSVKVTIPIDGDWSTNRPRPTTLADAPGKPYIKFSSSRKGPSSTITLHTTRAYSRDRTDGRLSIEYFAKAEDGDFPLSATIDDLSGYDVCSFALPIITSNYTKDGVGAVGDVEIVCSVNGVPMFIWTESTKVQVQLTNAGSRQTPMLRLTRAEFFDASHRAR